MTGNTSHTVANSTRSDDLSTIGEKGSVESRNRLRRVSQNFFLHIHAPKIQQETLLPAATLGLGVILAALFLVQLITGMLLMIHYSPSIENAYSSIKEIIFYVPGGRVLRNMHRWAAHAMVFVTFLHLFRTFYKGTYYGAGKTNWVIGIVILLVVMMMSFSGYLLPWDQLAYWAVTIGANIAASFRELTDLISITSWFDPGGWFKQLLIGGETVGQTTLARFFTLHAFILPVTLLALMGYHFWRIRKSGGLARKTTTDQKENQIPSWPTLLWAELAILLGVIAILLVVGLFLDAPLKTIANPNLPENPAKSPWYLLGIQETVSYSAFTGGFVLHLVFLAFLFYLPWYDREQNQFQGIWFSGKTGWKLTWITLLLCGVFTILLILLSLIITIPGKPGATLHILLTMFLNPGVLAVAGYFIWASIIHQSTKSTRMTAVALFTGFMTGWTLFMITGIWFRGENWHFVL